MKSAITILALLLAFGLSPSPLAFADAKDPFGNAFFPPELVLQYADELEISADDRASLKEEIESRRAAFETAQAAKLEASAELETILKKHPVNASAAMKTLDKLLSAETKMKRLHVEAMLYVRNQLTREQIAQIAELKRAPRLDEKEQEFVRSTIEPKMAQVKAAMAQHGKDGNPPPDEAPKLMQEFQKLMHGKKLEQAAEALDEILALVK